MAAFRQPSMLLSVGLGVLLLSFALQWLNVRDIKEGDRSADARPVKLGERLPRSLAGWSGRDEALGLNEVTRSAVERTLNYDDYVFRIFERGEKQIGVYVAYWSPGRMPLQKVASHTPDRCWVENGWHCDEVRHAQILSGATQALRAGEWRIFTAPGQQKLQVQFWHLVGSEVYDYGARLNQVPSPWRWWRDAARQVFRSPPEQYFIRVTSDRPFAELAGDPGWEQLLEKLSGLGLRDAGR